MNKLLRLFLSLCCLLAFAQHAYSQPDCQTAEQIEQINQGKLKKVAHIKSKNAVMFILLDPILSAPEFDHVPYRHEDDMKMIKGLRKRLIDTGIDEVVVWRLPRPRTLGVAVAFKDGCAVPGYGEPDELKKLKLMHETYQLITEDGLDDASVRDSVEQLIMSGRYGRHYKEEMIDIIINQLRPLMTINKKKSLNN